MADPYAEFADPLEAEDPYASFADQLPAAQAAETSAQQPVDTPERWKLQNELNSRLRAADQAGQKLSREESINKVVRPALRLPFDLGEGFFGPAKLAATAATVANPIGLGRLLTGKLSLSDLPVSKSLADVNPGAREALAPKTDNEQLITNVTQGLGGVLGGVGIGGVLARSALPAVSRAGQLLASNPGVQATGAVTGGVASEAARRSGAGAVGQTIAGVAGSLAPNAALGTLGKFATGAARTPEAQRLLNRGVDLTPGQLNPTGRLNQIEEGTQSIGLVGPTIASGRQNARDTFQRAAIQEGAAPGTTIKQAQPAQMLDEAYNSFKPLYDAAKGFPASPQIINAGQNVPLSGALRQAVRNAGIIATDEERKAVSRFLQSQLTKGVNSSDDLLNIRSSIRDESRQAFKGGNVERSRLLDAADDQVTQALESQLPQQALQKLKTADAKYGDYKTVEAAVARSKDRPGGFTPNDLSEAVAASGQGAGRGSYARGAGGSIRELASDARTVLDARSPPTGARLLALAPGAAAATIDPVTGLAVQGATTAGVVLGAGTQTGRRLAAGATAPQRAILNQLQQRGLINPGLPYSALAGQLSPTAQIVGEMLGIPRGAPPSPFLGLDQQQEEDRLRAGLYR